MKIIKLTAENVKRLRAVEITPDGHVQVVTGRNGQGKTSVLDAIWLALGGGSAARETVRPVRDGEDRASVTLDLGDLIVTRTWQGGKTSLTVTSPEGARYSSPQGMLDSLVGRLSFDPLAFTRLSARDQRAALLDLVDLDVDLDSLSAERAAAYDERTTVGRQIKAMGDVRVDDSLPVAERSASRLIAEIEQVKDANRDIATAQHTRGLLVDRIAELERELSVTRAKLAGVEALAGATMGDTAPLEADLEALEDINAAIRANNAARGAQSAKAHLEGLYRSLSDRIADVDARKADALAAAQMPVEGLGFTDEGVTYNGVPFSQASSAEQIRVSLAMAMALNPKLRVVRILDGSLLDADSMRQVAEMATAADYQVWVERVADDSASAVVIEDGAVQ